MDQPTVFPPFTVTDAAVSQIETLGGRVLIDLEAGGCCGTAFAFSALTEAMEQPSHAQEYGCPGAWLIVSKAAGEIMTGAVLDYSDRLKPPRFRVLRNPNTPDICPCKRSFGAAWQGPGSPRCRSYLPMPWDDTYDPPVRWKRQTGRS